jgi:hypothetical protein
MEDRARAIRIIDIEAALDNYAPWRAFIW